MRGKSHFLLRIPARLACTIASSPEQTGRGLDWRRILAESEAEFPLPDLVLLLELDPASGLARARDRGAALEGVFEREEYLARVAEIFRAIERPYVERIPAGGSVVDVQAAVAARVRERVGLR